MYLPEFYNDNEQRIVLSSFGGINRRLTAQAGELAHSVNMSSDEYPLLVPRKGYSVGEYDEFACMWHNNDLDYALVPAADPDDVLYVSDLIADTVGLACGKYVIIYTGAEATDYEIDGRHLVCQPNQAFGFTVNENGIDPDSFAWAPSKIIYSDKTIWLPTYIHCFKNPVTANIGTKTVILDEINGMWVLEYDKEADKHTYSKVHGNYTVANTIETVDNLPYVSGGNFIHLRVLFDNNTYPSGYAQSVTEEGGTSYKTHEEWLKAFAKRADNYNTLVHFGEGVDSGVWLQILSDGRYKAVDKMIYRFCLPDAGDYFRKGDYIQISNLKAYPGLTSSSSDAYINAATAVDALVSPLEGWHEITNVVYNGDYGWAIDIEAEPLNWGFFQYVLNGTNQYYDTDKGAVLTLKNDLYLADGTVIERKAPKNARFLCSYQNRIWCNNGDNEIMCCARGNPFVWYRYEGNTLDSWAATIGGDGAFTGCINYGYPLFFKDNRMFRMTGTRPSNFGFSEYSMRGIKLGCHDSAVIVNDVLYYQSIDGIYAYAQSTPVCVSDKVYRGSWQNGRACRFRNKYYIAVSDNTENVLYCYDTEKGVWHTEDMGGKDIAYMYPGGYLDKHEENMTVYVKSATGYIGYTMCTDNQGEEAVEWELETAELIADVEEYKYLKCIRVLFQSLDDEGGEVEIYRRSNKSNEWERVGNYITLYHTDQEPWYTRSVSPERCFSLRLRFVGRGAVAVRKIVLEFEKGSAER